jgi:hypothetical protein
MKKSNKANVLIMTFLFILPMLWLQACSPSAGDKTSFAIVIDAKTYENTAEAVDAYRSMLESEGLHTYLLSQDWNTPDEIKAELIRLYEKKPILEGAVFIGDIPIPMIRDAQHLTTAFKMDQQRFPFHRSSIPSDRFYDDFDLEFDYLGPDEERPLHHYYSLTSSSAQRIHTDIYSGRIKPPVSDTDPYEQISNYLNKVVADRQTKNKLNHAVTYAGHGYNSECLVAWGSERIAYKEQLPFLFDVGNSYKFLFTHMSDFSKNQILSEMQRPDLDLFILSNHGGSTAQYLDGWPNVSNIIPSIENVKRFLRSKLRDAERRGNLEETKKRFLADYGVPASWFAGIADAESIKEDSLFNANLDIYMPDVKNITPNARFIKFDACFNGSFQQDEYISGAYIFSEGLTIAGMANSVNVIQDNWVMELIGLLGEGVRIGNWARHIHYLENHIIGDPTFRFHSDSKTDWNKKIVLERDNVTFWKKQLDNDIPDIQNLALQMLFENDYPNLSDLLIDTYKNAHVGAVRMQALMLLRYYNDQNYYEVLKMGVSDPYELIRRMSVSFIGETGSDELIPALVSVQFEDAHSKRVLFNARGSAAFMNKDVLLEEIEKQYAESYLYHKEELKDRIFSMSRSSVLADLDIIQDVTQEDRHRLGEIRTLRNYTYHFGVPEYVKIAANPREKQEIRLAMIEALGWFTHSAHKGLIVDACERIVDNQLEDESIRDEASKTLNRLNVFSK